MSSRAQRFEQSWAAPETASAALVLLVAGAMLSGGDLLSAVLVGAGLLLGAGRVWASRSVRLVQLSLQIIGWWLLYGLIVGALPPLSDVGAVVDWATTEGRVLVTVAAMAISSTITQEAVTRRLLRRLVVMLTAGHSFAAVLFTTGIELPGFDPGRGDLFVGLTSSHHVVGFLSAVTALVVICMPRLVPRWVGTAAVLVAVYGIAASGSRTALVGLIAAGTYVAWRRLPRRQLAVAGAVGVVILGALVMNVERFRQTAEAVIDPGFPRELYDTFTSGSGEVAVSYSDSEAEANLLKRIALWGEASDDLFNSPLVGMGAFRQNDEELRFTGVRGLVYVATDGERRHNDSEPHNVLIYLLQEAGVVGLVLCAAPYTVVWRRTRRDGQVVTDDETGTDAVPVDDAVTPSVAGDDTGGGVPEEHAVLARATIVAALFMSLASSGVLATGLGLAAHAVIFSSLVAPRTSPAEVKATEEALA